MLSSEFVFSLISTLVWRVVQQSGSGMGPGLLDQRTQSASTSTILNTTNQHVAVISLNLRYHLMMEKWILTTVAAHSDQYIQLYLSFIPCCCSYKSWLFVQSVSSEKFLCFWNFQNAADKLIYQRMSPTFQLWTELFCWVVAFQIHHCVHPVHPLLATVQLDSPHHVLDHLFWECCVEQCLLCVLIDYCLCNCVLCPLMMLVQNWSGKYNQLSIVTMNNFEITPLTWHDFRILVSDPEFISIDAIQ